jgi:hypothetical protein
MDRSEAEHSEIAAASTNRPRSAPLAVLGQPQNTMVLAALCHRPCSAPPPVLDQAQSDGNGTTTSNTEGGDNEVAAKLALRPSSASAAASVQPKNYNDASNMAAEDNQRPAVIVRARQRRLPRLSLRDEHEFFPEERMDNLFGAPRQLQNGMEQRAAVLPNGAVPLQLPQDVNSRRRRLGQERQQPRHAAAGPAFERMVREAIHDLHREEDNGSDSVVESTGGDSDASSYGASSEQESIDGADAPMVLDQDDNSENSNGIHTSKNIEDKESEPAVHHDSKHQLHGDGDGGDDNNANTSKVITNQCLKNAVLLSETEHGIGPRYFIDDYCSSCGILAGTTADLFSYNKGQDNILDDLHCSSCGILASTPSEALVGNSKKKSFVKDKRDTNIGCEADQHQGAVVHFCSDGHCSSCGILATRCAKALIDKSQEVIVTQKTKDGSVSYWEADNKELKICHDDDHCSSCGILVARSSTTLVREKQEKDIFNEKEGDNPSCNLAQTSLQQQEHTLGIFSATKVKEEASANDPKHDINASSLEIYDGRSPTGDYAPQEDNGNHDNSCISKLNGEEWDGTDKENQPFHGVSKGVGSSTSPKPAAAHESHVKTRTTKSAEKSVAKCNKSYYEKHRILGVHHKFEPVTITPYYPSLENKMGDSITTEQPRARKPRMSMVRDGWRHPTHELLPITLQSSEENREKTHTLFSAASVRFDYKREREIDFPGAFTVANEVSSHCCPVLEKSDGKHDDGGVNNEKVLDKLARKGEEAVTSLMESIRSFTTGTRTNVAEYAIDVEEADEDPDNPKEAAGHSCSLQSDQSVENEESGDKSIDIKLAGLQMRVQCENSELLKSLGGESKSDSQHWLNSMLSSISRFSSHSTSDGRWSRSETDRIERVEDKLGEQHTIDGKGQDARKEEPCSCYGQRNKMAMPSPPPRRLHQNTRLETPRPSDRSLDLVGVLELDENNNENLDPTRGQKPPRKQPGSPPLMEADDEVGTDADQFKHKITPKSGETPSAGLLRSNPVIQWIKTAARHQYEKELSPPPKLKRRELTTLVR